MDRKGDLDGQAAPHCLLGVLGSPGLGCMVELKGKERLCRARVAAGQRPIEDGAASAEAAPQPRHPQLQAESSRGGMLHRARQAGCPVAPQVLLNPQRLLSWWQLLCVSEHRAVLASGGGCSGPQHSDEPLLGRQLEVGGRRHAGTHLLLAAGPVGALCLPLFTQFSHQQHEPHGQKQGSQEGEDHNDGSDGPLRLQERGQVDCPPLPEMHPGLLIVPTPSPTPAWDSPSQAPATSGSLGPLTCYTWDA